MKTKLLLLLLALSMLTLSACAGRTQESVNNRNEEIGIQSADSNFAEAKQVAEAEEWKDQEGKIVNLYLLNPVTGGLLIPPVQCKGVPNSSTESLEPNYGGPWYGGYETWRVPIDGTDVSTNEMTGRDGTFGEPVPFRYCMSVDGQYYDFPALGLPYLVTSAYYTFPDATINRNYETEAKLLIAEEILKRGGCISPETLTEIPCPAK